MTANECTVDAQYTIITFFFLAKYQNQIRMYCAEFITEQSLGDKVGCRTWRHIQRLKKNCTMVSWFFLKQTKNTAGDTLTVTTQMITTSWRHQQRVSSLIWSLVCVLAGRLEDHWSKFSKIRWITVTSLCTPGVRKYEWLTNHFVLMSLQWRFSLHVVGWLPLFYCKSWWKWLRKLFLSMEAYSILTEEKVTFPPIALTTGVICSSGAGHSFHLL